MSEPQIPIPFLRPQSATELQGPARYFEWCAASSKQSIFLKGAASCSVGLLEGEKSEECSYLQLQTSAWLQQRADILEA